jgi:hypothetical protein
MELRSYIEQFNIDIVTAMEHNNRDTGRPKYQKSSGGGGKPTLERMLSVESLHMFELYSSVVLIDKSKDKGVLQKLIDEIREKNI